MKKNFLFGVLVSFLIFGGVTVFVSQQRSVADTSSTQSGVSVQDGTQYIDMTAKGGYTPRRITARAGIPTVLNVSTRATFDCSTSIVIPSLDVRQTLPSSGVTKITLGTYKSGDVVAGSCSMGMYGFEIVFSS